MDTILLLSEQQSLQFQLSLFSDLVYYTGMDEPIRLMERIVKEASVFGMRDKRLSHQIAQYFVKRLNFRIFDWGCCCVLFSHRLVRITGCELDFTIARIMSHWMEQVEAALFPHRSLVREAAALVEEVANRRNEVCGELWRDWAWDAITRSCESGRLHQYDYCDVYMRNADRLKVAETASINDVVDRGAQLVSVFDIARVLKSAPSGQIIPIVKYSHYAPWVDELEKMRKRSMYEHVVRSAVI